MNTEEKKKNAIETAYEISEYQRYMDWLDSKKSDGQKLLEALKALEDLVGE